MPQRLALYFSLGSRLLLAVTTTAALAMPGLFGQANTIETQTQTPRTITTSMPSFEVVSIKPNHSEEVPVTLGLHYPDRFTATNVTVQMIIEWAFTSGYRGNLAVHSLRHDQILGGPRWLNSEKYDIDAKVEDSLVEEQKKTPSDQWTDEARLMVQSMLAERFKLQVSRATKELPVYSLVIAKSGPRLTQSDIPPIGPIAAAHLPDSGRPKMRMGMGQISGTGMLVGDLAEALSREPELAGRGVIDRTGIKGTYDFKLQWTPERPIPQPDGMSGGPESVNASPPDSLGVSIFTAIQEQLGLKLVPGKGPVEVLVIDHVERPSVN